jgi:hypothetical protein
MEKIPINKGGAEILRACLVKGRVGSVGPEIGFSWSREAACRMPLGPSLRWSDSNSDGGRRDRQQNIVDQTNASDSIAGPLLGLKSLENLSYRNSIDASSLALKSKELIESLSADGKITTE